MSTEPTFGQLLRGIREEKEMTQQALADAAGLSRVQIARLETDVRSPSWETVKALCAALGVGADAFMPPRSRPTKSHGGKTKS